MSATFSRLQAAGLVVALTLTGACDSGKTPASASKDGSEAAKAEAPKEAGTNNAAASAKDNAKAAKEAPAEKAVAPFVATGAVATVNGTPIAADTYNDRLGKMANMTRSIPAQALPKFSERLVNELVDAHLIEESVQKKGYKATDAEVDTEFNNFKNNFPKPADLDQFLERTGFTVDDIRKDMRRAVALKKLLQKEYNATVPDADVKKFFEENKARFGNAEQVKASHILLKVAKDAKPDEVEKVKKKAEEVLKETSASAADFAELAKKYSEGPSAPRGGDLGFFDRKKMVPPFAEAAFKAKVGDITGPVRTDFGFHIIKVVDRKAAEEPDFAKAKEQIVRQLERKVMTEAMKKFLDSTKSGAKIEVHAEAIKENPEFKPAAAPSPHMVPGLGGKMPPKLDKKIVAKPKQAAPATTEKK